MANLILALSLIVLLISIFHPGMKASTIGLFMKVAALTVFFSTLIASDSIRNSQLDTKAIFGLLWIYLFFIYFLGVKHVMGLGFFENITHDKFKEFAKEKGAGYFSNVLLILAPTLFWSMVILLIIIIFDSLAKSYS